MSPTDGTRDRIEEVALALLLERGYEGTPMRLIAEAADLTTPALYWHFPSKGELCASAVAREYERFSDAITAVVVPGRPDEQLRVYVRSFVAYQLERRRGRMGLGFDDLVASLPDAHRGRIAEIQRPLHRQLRGILAEGKRLNLFSCSDPTVAAFAVTTMCNYVFTWFKPGGRLGIEEVASEYADMAIKLVGSDAGSQQLAAVDDERLTGDPARLGAD
jgi:AcrR family transcriptional regulator